MSRRQEPTAVDEVRAKSCLQLFHPNDLFSGKVDTANSFARDYYTIREEIVDPVLTAPTK